MTNNPTRRRHWTGIRSVLRGWLTRLAGHEVPDGVAKPRKVDRTTTRTAHKKNAKEGQERKQNGQARRDRSIRWAIGLAILVAFVAAPPIVFGLGWSVIWLCAVITILAAGLSFANKQTAVWMGANLRKMSVHRLVLSILLAACVAGGAAMWLFDERVDDVRAEQDPASWTRETRRLAAERQKVLDVIDEPVPVVTEDPEVRRLQAELSDANEELSTAERNMLCELDGTCGTEVEGKADAYYSKRDYWIRCKGKVADLAGDLTREKGRVTTRAEALTDRQAVARERVPDIDARLDELGGERPTRPSRPVALATVADRDTVHVGGTLFLTFFTFIAFDWGLLTVVEHRILRRHARKGTSIPDKVRRRAENRAAKIIDAKNWPTGGAAGPPENGERP